MKPVLATIIGLAIAAFATTATAHVVEVTTSIPAVKASDEAELKEALESVIDDAVNRAIGFTPTIVTLENLRRVGDRIYIVLLIADHDGEELIKALASEATDTSPEPVAVPDHHTERI